MSAPLRLAEIEQRLQDYEMHKDDGDGDHDDHEDVRELRDAAPGDIAYLLGRIRVLQDALAPFAKIATFHAIDTSADACTLNIVNLLKGVRSNEWYLHGGADDPALTVGDLRRARAVLGDIE